MVQLLYFCFLMSDCLRIDHFAFDSRAVILDTVLKFHQPVKHRFRSWGASCDVNIHRNQTVNALQHRVVLVETPGRGTSTEGNHPFWFRHLLINCF